jgi:butyryl-CoA dehydrogenase
MIVVPASLTPPPNTSPRWYRAAADTYRDAMRSTLLSRRDLDFLLYEWLDVELLTKRPRYAEHSRDTFDAVLELSEQVATEHFAPHNKKNDAQEPYVGDDGRVVLVPEVKAALDVFAQTGLVASSMDESVGGMQLPHVVSGACFAWFQAANVGTSSYPFLSIGAANLLLEHGTPEQVETYVRRWSRAASSGTMCLSEPQAGSSLSDVDDPGRAAGRRQLPAVRQQDVDQRRATTS